MFWHWKKMINNYRSRKIGNKYLVTTDHGSVCILDKSEMIKLKSLEHDKKFYDAGIILDDNNIEEVTRLYSQRLKHVSQGTSLHIVVVTLRCDMSCIYCHASSKSKSEKGFDMDKDTAKKTVDFIFQSPSPSVTIEFQGGEPLLNFEIIKFITEYAYEKNEVAKKNLRLTIVTNMTTMDNEKMEYIIDNDIDICSSLDGPKELHDKNRLCKTSNYNQVTDWLKKFAAEYKKRGLNKSINAVPTLTKDSLNYSKEIVDEFVSLGLRVIHLRSLNKLGVAKKVWGQIKYTPQEFLKFWKETVTYIAKLQDRGVKISERMVNIMTDKFTKERDPNYLELRVPCGAAIGQLTYNHDGKIYTCDEARMIGDDLFMLGTVENSYPDIVTCDKACAVLNASINDQFMCDNCAYKPFCGLCPVCNYSEQGSIIAKIPQTDRCTIYMDQFDWVISEKIINKKATKR